MIELGYCGHTCDNTHNKRDRRWGKTCLTWQPQQTCAYFMNVSLIKLINMVFNMVGVVSGSDSVGFLWVMCVRLLHSFSSEIFFTSRWKKMTLDYMSKTRQCSQQFKTYLILFISRWSYYKIWRFTRVFMNSIYLLHIIKTIPIK